MRRRLVAGLGLAVLLGTAACSGSGGSAPARLVSLTAVHVSGPANKAPNVHFTAPIAFKKTQSEIIDHGSGTGPAVKPSSLVTVKYVAINASDEAVFGTSWHGSGKPSTFYVNSALRGFDQGLLGAHAGDRVLIGAQAKDAFDGTGNLSASVRPGDSVIFVVDVVKVFPELKLPPTVPQLTYDKDGNPAKFTAGPGVTKKPTKLGVYPVVEGPGPKVHAGETISASYFGQIYPAGNVFNSWNSFDATLGAGQVIKGWDTGLVGQRVGSRLVLVIPPSLGYGKKSQQGIPANSTLIFTVQITSVG